MTDIEEIVRELQRITERLGAIALHLAGTQPQLEATLQASPVWGDDVPIQERATREGQSYVEWFSHWRDGLASLQLPPRIHNPLERAASLRISTYGDYRPVQRQLFADPEGYLLPFNDWMRAMVEKGPPASVGNPSPLIHIRNVGRGNAQIIYEAMVRQVIPEGS